MDEKEYTHRLKKLNIDHLAEVAGLYEKHHWAVKDLQTAFALSQEAEDEAEEKAGDEPIS